ncbi:hypothetical protein BpHYR1_030989, partial [Brachionus plicatilis]
PHLTLGYFNISINYNFMFMALKNASDLLLNNSFLVSSQNEALLERTLKLSFPKRTSKKSFRRNDLKIKLPKKDINIELPKKGPQNRAFEERTSKKAFLKIAPQK